MPAWQGIFQLDEIKDLVSYIRSLAAASDGGAKKR